MSLPEQDLLDTGLASTAARHRRVLVLTCREPETDFRLPLAEELQALGHDVAYVRLKRRPVIVEMREPAVRREVSLAGFLRYAVSTFRPAERLLVFNTTNLVFPGLSRILRLLIGGLWCFDMHDELLYNRMGRRRAKMEKAQATLLAGSDLVVHAAPTLAELFPRSHHLGNASFMRPVERPDAGFDRILVLASLDERLDFEVLARVAELNPDLGFDIYGQISEGDPAVTAKVEALKAARPNVSYKGRYVNGDLPGILAAYRVTFAPYATENRLTRYIDPLRFYHCLNSGMEVVSTDIPGARNLDERLHVVGSPDEIGPLVAKLASGTGFRNSSASPVTWRDKARRLIEIIEGAAGKAVGRSKA